MHGFEQLSPVPCRRYLPDLWPLPLLSVMLAPDIHLPYLHRKLAGFCREHPMTSMVPYSACQPTRSSGHTQVRSVSAGNLAATSSESRQRFLSSNCSKVCPVIRVIRMLLRPHPGPVRQRGNLGHTLTGKQSGFPGTIL